MKRPSFQFYPGDWLRDSALRSCSIGARGLWIDMICLMHEGTPYGYLKVANKVILPANLARMVGATLAETEGWLGELRDTGVFSENTDGIHSRRMIRDEEIRVKRAAGGIKGGNPALLSPKPKVNLPANLELTPSSSSSSSSSSSEVHEEAKASSCTATDASSIPTKAKGSSEECRAYAGERGLPATDGEAFFDKMLGSGWENAGRTVKDWRATFRVWQAHGYHPSQKGHLPARNGTGFIP